MFPALICKVFGFDDSSRSGDLGRGWIDQIQGLSLNDGELLSGTVFNLLSLNGVLFNSIFSVDRYELVKYVFLVKRLHEWVMFMFQNERDCRILFELCPLPKGRFMEDSSKNGSYQYGSKVAYQPYRSLLLHYSSRYGFGSGSCEFVINTFAFVYFWLVDNDISPLSVNICRSFGVVFPFREVLGEIPPTLGLGEIVMLFVKYLNSGLIGLNRRFEGAQHGKICLCKSWITWSAPELLFVSPLVVVGSADVVHDDSSLESFSFPSGPPNVLSHCFIEIENEFKGNSFPVIIANTLICKELRLLEVELNGPQVSNATLEDQVQDLGKPNSREDALHFLNELGWIFQRKDSPSRLDGHNFSHFDCCTDSSRKYLFIPNQARLGGVTPLHFAAYMNDSEPIVEALINDPHENTHEDANGPSPSAYATMRDNHSYNRLAAQNITDRKN
ncbi:hypothetical protein GIB67_010315, partial [Kingdonia uniflora]